MDWEVIWMDPATADFEAAIEYVARDAPAAARALRQAVLDSVALLAKFPEIGPLYGRDRMGRTREIICHPYRIFYRLRPSERRVEVLAVWHSSRREPRLPS